MTREERKLKYAEIFSKVQTPDDQRYAYRELCKKDLFFLIYECFNRKDIDNDFLYARCMEVQNSPDGHLDLWARNHYKSTIITYAKTIQDILINPEVTICLFAYNRSLAKASLRQIKREFEGNYNLKFYFDDIVWQNPEREAPKWSEDDGIILKRRTNPKESTVEAFGLVDGQPIGRHYNLLIYDDVVVESSITTPDMIAKTTGMWELSLSIASLDTRFRYIGTRYHYADTYKTMIDRGVIRSRIHQAVDKDGNSVFFPQDVLDDRRKSMGPYRFASQYMLDPVPEGQQVFQEMWLQYWDTKKTKGLNVYVFVDPANEKKKSSDYTSIWVIGAGADKNFYVLDMYRDKLNLTERTNLIMKLHREYLPRVTYYEQYGLQSDIQHIRYVQNQENYRFVIQAVGGKVKKEDRIRELVPIFENNRIYLPENMWKNTIDGRVDLVRVFIDEEYRAFPYCAHDDMLDSLARISDEKVYIAYPHVSETFGITTFSGSNSSDEANNDYDPFSTLRRIA